MLPNRILVPTDFSECATRALAYACELASKVDATVYLVNCLGPTLPEMNMALTQTMFDDLRGGALRAVEDLAAARPATRFGMLSVVPGDARDVILDVADRHGIEMIVLGTHGRRGFARLVLGSVAEHVVRRAMCPVVTVRGVKS